MTSNEGHHKPKMFTNADCTAEPRKDQGGTQGLSCVMEAFTVGGCRAHVRATLKDNGSGLLEVTPFYFRKISGLAVPWSIPRTGAPIDTRAPITSFDQANAVLIAWATQTLTEIPATSDIAMKKPLPKGPVACMPFRRRMSLIPKPAINKENVGERLHRA